MVFCGVLCCGVDSCFDDTWNSFIGISMFFVLLYPVGVPLFFLGMLLHYRTSFEKPSVRAQLGFLYDGIVSLLISSHLISSHFISSHLIQFHLISFHFISSLLISLLFVTQHCEIAGHCMILRSSAHRCVQRTFTSPQLCLLCVALHCVPVCRLRQEHVVV